MIAASAPTGSRFIAVVRENMFTGLITDIGRVEAVDGGAFRISSSYRPETIALGASIACDGCCLTVTDRIAGSGGEGCTFSVDVSNETLSATTLGTWGPGRRVNLERALTLKDELGGHIVTGHVDAVAEIVERVPDGESVRFAIAIPDDLKRYIARKGSVALDGISLTVNEVEDARFGINMIPHTLAETSWDEKQVGDKINLEVDLLARYVARISDVEAVG